MPRFGKRGPRRGPMMSFDEGGPGEGRKPESKTRVTRIQVRGPIDVEVHVTPATGGSYAVRSNEPVDPELLRSIDELARHLITLLDLPAAYSKDLTMTGLKATWEGDEATVVLTAEKRIRGLGKRLKISTPPSGFTGEAREDLDAAMIHALAFAEGKRAQVELFEEEVI